MITRLLYATVFLLPCLLLTSCGKSEEPSKMEDRVMDGANLLTAEEETRLFRIVQELERKVGSQLAIITIDSLNGVAIEEYSLDKLNEMSLGRDQYYDGVLITVALRNKEMRIEVGWGLERILTNEKAERINLKLMAPRFREKKFYEGLRAAAGAITLLIEENKDRIRKRR